MRNCRLNLQDSSLKIIILKSVARLQQPHLCISCNMINYRCTVVRVYTESDSSGWYELLYPPAKNLFSSHSLLPQREGEKQRRVLTGSDFSSRVNSPQCVWRDKKSVQPSPSYNCSQFKSQPAAGTGREKVTRGQCPWPASGFTEGTIREKMKNIWT